VILSGSGPPAFFAQAAAVIVGGALVAYIGARLGLVTIVGFLVAGVVIGPHGLGVVRDPALVDAAAELGVVLLLFTIGIEFSFEKLARIRRQRPSCSYCRPLAPIARNSKRSTPGGFVAQLGRGVVT